MNSAIYVPVIKGKKNDVIALGKLPLQIRSRVKPLIEAMPVNLKKSKIDEHVFKFCDYIKKNAPIGEMFVDFYGLMPEATTEDGTNATLYGYQILKGLGLSATPTYGLERNDDLWQPLRNIVNGFGKGFAFRLRRDDLAEDLFDETWESIVQHSATLGLKENEIDLILDFATVSPLELPALKENIISFLFHNPRVGRYRSIVITASSALKDVSEVEKDGISEVSRSELQLWSDLWRDMPDQIKPIYGDYGVIHPDFSDIGPNKYMNAKIRYTVGDKILYFRGHGLLWPVKDYEQYHDLAARVVADSRFRESAFSFGDKYLKDCSLRLGKTGAPGPWVKADMNHHLTYAVYQIERLQTIFATSDMDAKTQSEAISAI